MRLGPFGPLNHRFWRESGGSLCHFGADFKAICAQARADADAASNDANLEARFPVGTRLRILPNHACATGAQFPEYHAQEPGGDVAVWSRFHGW